MLIVGQEKATPIGHNTQNDSPGAESGAKPDAYDCFVSPPGRPGELIFLLK